MKNYQFDSVSFRIDEELDEEITEEGWELLTKKGLEGWRIAGVVQFHGWVEVLLEKEGTWG